MTQMSARSFGSRFRWLFEQGRLKFEAPKKTMKIDGHPFATNMVDMARDEGSPQAKILMSSTAKRSGAVDPKMQIAADEVKGKGPMEDAGCSSVPCRRVTSQMLLNKFQCDRERWQHREEEERCEQDHWRCPFCHRHMIVPNAMVKAADHMKGRVMSPIGVSALLCMIG